MLIIANHGFGFVGWRELQIATKIAMARRNGKCDDCRSARSRPPPSLRSCLASLGFQLDPPLDPNVKVAGGVRQMDLDQPKGGAEPKKNTNQNQPHQPTATSYYYYCH